MSTEETLQAIKIVESCLDSLAELQAVYKTDSDYVAGRIDMMILQLVNDLHSLWNELEWATAESGAQSDIQ